RLRGIAGESKDGHRGDHHAKQNRDPARGAGGFVAVRLLRARYVWRNAHSPSSMMGAMVVDSAEGEVWLATRWKSTGGDEERWKVCGFEGWGVEEAENICRT